MKVKGPRGSRVLAITADSPAAALRRGCSGQPNNHITSTAWDEQALVSNPQQGLESPGHPHCYCYSHAGKKACKQQKNHLSPRACEEQVLTLTLSAGCREQQRTIKLVQNRLGLDKSRLLHGGCADFAQACHCCLHLPLCTTMHHKTLPTRPPCPGT